MIEVGGIGKDAGLFLSGDGKWYANKSTGTIIYQCPEDKTIALE